MIVKEQKELLKHTITMHKEYHTPYIRKTEIRKALRNNLIVLQQMQRTRSSALKAGARLFNHVEFQMMFPNQRSVEL